MKLKSIIKDKYQNGNLKGQLQTAAVVTGVGLSLGIGMHYGKGDNIAKNNNVAIEQESKDTNYSYNELKSCVLLSVNNNSNGESTLYIANKTKPVHKFDIIYTDLFSKKELITINSVHELDGITNKNKNLSCAEKGNLTDYLVTSDNIKNTYTKSELERLLNSEKEKEKEKSNKQLVK